MTVNPKNLQATGVLQESQRFLVQTVAWNDGQAVLKQAKTPDMFANVEQELLAYQIYGQIAQAEHCPFTLASVIDAGPGWMLLSFLHGQSMRELLNDTNDDVYYQKLAGIMAFCDNKVAVMFGDKRAPLPEQVLATQRSRISEFLEGLDALAKYDAVFLRDGLTKAAAFYAANAEQLETCFVNSDLTPAHVMVHDDQLAIFDFENAKLIDARFADVVNQATKIWFFQGNKEKALNFFDSFWDASGESASSHALQLKTLLYKRCLGFAEELLTEPNQHHNTSETMNVDFAQNIAAVLAWADELQ
jgi:hypothetical protein